MANLINEVDLSRQAWRLGVVRLMDYGLVYMSLQFLLQTGVRLVFDRPGGWDLFWDLAVLGLAGYAF